MNLTRKLMLAAGAMVLPFAAVITIGAGSASAARTNGAGTGLVSCTKVSGTIKFSPPLTATGSSPETAKIKATASGCTGGSPTPTKITTTSTINTGTSACSGLATASPPTLTEKYTSKPKVSTSGISGGTETEVTSPTIGFTLSGETTVGSYPNSGGTSVSASTNETESAFGTACAGKGVKTLKITSGSVTDL